MEPAPKLVIARPRRGRGNLAVPCRITGKLRRNRNCLPEIAPQGHFLALRAQGATSACGLLAMTNRKPSPLYHTRHESGTCHGASRMPPPTTHDRRLPVILPARFCGEAPSSVLIRELVVLLLLHPDIHHELMRQQLHEPHLPAHGQAVDGNVLLRAVQVVQGRLHHVLRLI